MRLFFIYLITLCGLFACTANYSFTGASISPETKTISIQYFTNETNLAPPSISQDFTEALRDVFLSQTNLVLVENGGDLQLSGKITGYRTEAIAVQTDDFASGNRLQITVNAKFVNRNDEIQNFAQSFNRFADFNGDQDLSSVEAELIKNVNDQLIQDIFNRAVSNW